MSNYIPTWMQSWPFEEPITHNVYKNGLISSHKVDPLVLQARIKKATGLEKVKLQLSSSFLKEKA